jgi:hypothetical protein
MSTNLTIVKQVSKKKSEGAPGAVLDYAAFDRWAADLDELVKDNKEMESFTEQLQEYVDDEFKGKTIEGWMLAGAQRYLAIDFKTKQAKCEEFRKIFDPDSLYDRDPNVHWKIKRSVVNARLAQFVDSFLNQKPSEYFLQLLLEEVITMSPSNIELEGACRQLIRSKPFYAISEMRAALKEQTSLWGERWSAVEVVDNTQEELRAVFAKVEKKIALEKAMQGKANDNITN